EEEAIDLLHSVCFKAALEGQLKPIYFQGKVVGQFRKFDSRLAIELLRAHMPNTFRTPGAKVNVNTGNQVGEAGPSSIRIRSPRSRRCGRNRFAGCKKRRQKQSKLGGHAASNEAAQLGTVPALPVPSGP